MIDVPIFSCTADFNREKEMVNSTRNRWPHGQDDFSSLELVLIVKHHGVHPGDGAVLEGQGKTEMVVGPIFSGSLESGQLCTLSSVLLNSRILCRGSYSHCLTALSM